eukprot:scaffold33055_cov55-Phaeocystis_antarctica.AAC.7
MDEAARRHQPVDGTSAPLEVLAVPCRVSIGKVREIPCRGGPAGAARPGVDVYQRRAAFARTGIEHLAHALHRASVEVDPIIVDAVDVRRLAS